MFIIRALDWSGASTGLRESERCARVGHLVSCCPLVPFGSNSASVLEERLAGRCGCSRNVFPKFP